MSRHPSFLGGMLFLLLILIFSAISSAATHQVPRVQGMINPDGYMNEEVWHNAVTVELNYEVEPGENIPALVRTVAYFAYNVSNKTVSSS